MFLTASPSSTFTPNARYSVVSHCYPFVRLLLEKGADPTCQPYDKEKHPCPLYEAASRNRPEVCELLLRFGADVEQKFKAFISLQIATQQKHTKVIKILQAATATKAKLGNKNEAKNEVITAPAENDKKHPPPPTSNPPISDAAVAAADAAFADLLATVY